MHEKCDDLCLTLFCIIRVCNQKVKIETASGVINAYIFKIKTFFAIDTTLTDIEVCSYDFFTNHLFTDFDGVLGLDFFKGVKFCVDMNQSIITIQ